MRRISEENKIDLAIAPEETTSVRSKYFSLKTWDRALFAVTLTPVGASAIVSTSLLTLYQAKDASAATSAAALADGTAVISLNKKVCEFTITPGVASAADTVSITGYDNNGDAVTALIFTASNGGTTAATASTSRLFSINDTAGGTGLISNICTTLAAILNCSKFGVPGLYASAGSTNVTCVAMNPGDNMFTLTSSTTANLALRATKIIGLVQVNASALTISSGFTHVAVDVANAISAYTSAICIRSGRKRKMPVQMVGAITTVGE